MEIYLPPSSTRFPLVAIDAFRLPVVAAHKLNNLAKTYG